MGASDPSNGPIRIDLEDEFEGEQVGTTDYFFAKIGESVPLKGDDSNFDPESLPSQPLAVSERLRLIFVAHSSGFFVARTKDVIDSAKEFKERGSGSPIQQLSLVDVSIGRVHILALSTDNSTLAASVSGDIRFYSVDNFLYKEVKQSFFCSLNGSTFVKDMRWITTSEKSLVILSNTGKLYYGEAGFPLKFLMDSVEAVDWGVKGKFVAVARKNVLSILSAKFEELVSISLSFRAWIGDSVADCIIKVDSVKCVRPDSIVIGCFQLTGDGKEQNYLLKVIRSRHGEIIDGCSELVVQSFYDIYQGLIDDIVPIGSGPYLLLAYLEQCQLAINANMKNTDQHIVLLGWSVDDCKSEAVIVDIQRDNWVPRIELQENGDDNLLIGLCIDNVSIYQKVGVQLCAEERSELSPYCVLICLTLEGKLVMFHVASLAGNVISPEVVSHLPDEEDACGKLHVGDCSTFFDGLHKRELDQASEMGVNLKSKPFANLHQITHAEDFTEYCKVESVANLRSAKADVPQIFPDEDLNQETGGENPCPSQEQHADSGHISSKAFIENTFKGVSSLAGEKTAGLGTSICSLTAILHPTAPGLSCSNNLQETTAMTKLLWNTNGSWDSHSVSHQLPGEAISFPKDPDLSSFSTSSSANGVGHQSQLFSVGATNILAASIPGSIGGKPFKDHGQLTSVEAVHMEQGSSHLSSNGNTAGGKASLRKIHPSNEQHGVSSKIGKLSPNLSKQFGNINEMTKELDLLLRSIEEAGGFRDACTGSLKSSIEKLEQDMHTVSTKCKMWKCQVDEHLEEVHHHLNKTIQVVARKVCMEGIYKQASDSRYWDVWNQQKLNSELELKRQHILSVNQDLTNQLIELERHFNALELNKFSQYGGLRFGNGAFHSRYRPSRHIQPLYSLHNAIGSQLTAAVNLSECLSKQMATLSLSSLLEEQNNVKELFETIGIPYDNPFGSPDMKGLFKTSSSKKLLFSDWGTSKDRSNRIHASAIKSSEPELARRRRDSLEQSWTCFEPSKTVVKRMLLQELQKPNWNRSCFSMNREKVKTSMLEESAPHQTDTRTPSIVFPDSKMKGILDPNPDEVSEHPEVLMRADNVQSPTQLSENMSPVFQRSNVSAVLSWPASQPTPAMVHGYQTETQEIPSLLIKSGEMSASNGKVNMATSSMMGDKHDFPSSASHLSTISAASTLFGKFTEYNVDKIPAEGILSIISSSVSSATAPAIAVSVAFSRCLSSSNTGVDSIQILSTSSASASRSTAASSVSLPIQCPKHTLSTLPNPSCLNLNLESVKSDIQSADLDAAEEAFTQLAEPLNGESELKLGPSGNFSPSSEQSSDNITSSALSVISILQPKQHSNSPMQLSTSFVASATGSSGKNGALDVGIISDEDEMEEEAPETSSTIELGLGSLGGFGISSIPNPSTTPVNPFGGSFSTVTSLASSTTPFSVPVGELFRPASFTFPSPQSSAPSQSTNSVAFSGGLSSGSVVPAPTSSVFGQPAQIGSGQQVLGSVLGTFGQSRQLGSGLPGSGFAASSGIGGGFAGSGSNSGFSSAATGGGFAGIASTGGGFAGIASTGGGFASVTSIGGGFAGVMSTGCGFSGIASPVGATAGASGFGGGGFAAVSSSSGFPVSASGGGFGAFSSQGSGGGFATFGAVGGSKPPELFTQMRK